ncbi:MAG: AmmeMemoRadiSam system protein B [Spirochaetes bacterium]|nr:AmmeMemoRadiSam system protein B [Spirochaetota bacterium]
MYRRRPAVAGSFYPSSPQRLESMIKEYLGEAKGSVQGEVVGLVSPHAGYVYSGPVAAYSYGLLSGSGVNCAVILAPSHRARFNGAAVLTDGIYETPLGDVSIDADIGQNLINRDGFGVIREAHEMEHSLEVQVPFLQKVLDTFTIVPLIVGTVDLDICRGLAAGIHEAMSAVKKRYVVVISTDLSHYYAYETARTMDGKFIDALASMDEKKVKDVISSGKAEACGEGPILAGMALCKLLGAERVEVLKYANSGDTAGSKDQVVGYLSAAFLK